MEDSLDWIVFHEVVWTTRIYARTVCPVGFLPVPYRYNKITVGGQHCLWLQVRYEWLKELLPRLHVVDVHMLSSAGEVDRIIDEKPTVLTVSEQEDPTEEGGFVAKLEI